uniref:Nucleoporin n=1 Tax=Trypanosoma congolense (strain IL3000) TaxID=1068625 RepID=G0UX76_TRYCI|nr:conserved hypothetical protein [Trypanosoma congolense IL3000]
MEMNSFSLLGHIARELAPLVAEVGMDDADALQRRIQLFSTEPLRRCSSRDLIWTPYIFSGNTRQENNSSPSGAVSNVVKCASEGTLNSACGMFPLETVLEFTTGENMESNRIHVFELNLFLQVLHRNPKNYGKCSFWCALIQRLGELDFYGLLKTNIVTLWNTIKDEYSGGVIFNELRLLQITCDVLLHFSEHAAATPPSVELLSEFVALAEQMWVEDAPFIVQRCAVVVSAFLTHHASLVPYDVLSTICGGKRNAPYLLVAAGKVPALFRGEATCADEDLSRLLGIVFGTTAYSIPTVRYFRGEGPQSNSLSCVQRIFATVVRELLTLASEEFWQHFTGESLLSIVESAAVYARLWDSFPPGLLVLLRCMGKLSCASPCKQFLLSVFSYCTAAAAYHHDIGRLGYFVGQYGEGDLSVIKSFPPELPHGNQEMGSTGGRENNQQGGCMSENPPRDATEGDRWSAARPQLKDIFELLVTEWGSFQPGDRVFLRSSLVLLHALLLNFTYQMEELELIIGYRVSWLFRSTVMGLLVSDIEDPQIMETVYAIVFRFYEMFDVSVVMKNLLGPSSVKGLGVDSVSSEKVLMQMQLCAVLLESLGDTTTAPGALLDVAMNIRHGIVFHSPLATSFFLRWVFTGERAVLKFPWLVNCPPSHETLGNRLIQYLCEGVFTLIREHQSGNVIVDGYSVVAALECVVNFMFTLVFSGDCQGALATCVFTPHGGSGISACFMLYCLLFSANVSPGLVKAVARLIACVVEGTTESLFTTMRHHTSIEMKKRLQTDLHGRLSTTSSQTPSNSLVVRLAALRHLLQYDPATFYYIVVPEDTVSNCTELPLTAVLRDIVKSTGRGPLEKAEALSCLKSLGDVSIPTTEVTGLLSRLQVDSPLDRSFFIAAAVHYVCGAYIHERDAENRQHSNSSGEPPLQTKNCDFNSVKTTLDNTTIINYQEELSLMLRCGLESMKQCVIFFEVKQQDRHYNRDSNGLLPSLGDARLSEHHSFLAQTDPVERSMGSTTVERYSLVDTRQMYPAQPLRNSSFLPADGVPLWEGAHDIGANALASALVAITRLATSLEALLWLTSGEKESVSISVQLFEVTLNALHVLGTPKEQLQQVGSLCLSSLLELGHASLSAIAQGSDIGSSDLQPCQLNLLLCTLVKDLAAYRENIDVVTLGLRILTRFRPLNLQDEQCARQLFDIILCSAERQSDCNVGKALFNFLSEASTIFVNMGAFCPTRCALSIVECLWTCAVNISHVIILADLSPTLTDKFNAVVDTICVILLRCSGVMGCLTYTRIMPMLTAVGQLSSASSYDPVDKCYKPQAWHRVWMSLLRLAHTVLVCCSGGDGSVKRWPVEISTWAATSSRFRDALSGFTCHSLSTGELKAVEPHSWEWREMHMCTRIVTVLSSLGVATPSFIPYVRRCFSRIRKFSCLPTNSSLEKSLEDIFLASVRYQLTFLIQQSPPSGNMEGGSVVVSVARCYALTHGSVSPLLGSQTLQVTSVNGEEQLSFYMLRNFIFRELNILRKSCRDDASCGGSLPSPDCTPSQRLASLNGSMDAFSEADVTEGCLVVTVPHVLNIQLALILFVRNARHHTFGECLDPSEQYELFEGVNELYCALLMLAHFARRIDNAKLAMIAATIREELRMLSESLRSGV